MPHKDLEERKLYQMGYFAGYRKATIDHLNKKCVVCGATEKIEIHHKKGLTRKTRQLKDFAHLKNLELRCQKHHTRRWLRNAI